MDSYRGQTGAVLPSVSGCSFLSLSPVCQLLVCSSPSTRKGTSSPATVPAVHWPSTGPVVPLWFYVDPSNPNTHTHTPHLGGLSDTLSCRGPRSWLVVGNALQLKPNLPSYLGVAQTLGHSLARFSFKTSSSRQPPSPPLPEAHKGWCVCCPVVLPYPTHPTPRARLDREVCKGAARMSGAG